MLLLIPGRGGGQTDMHKDTLTGPSSLVDICYVYIWMGRDGMGWDGH